MNVNDIAAKLRAAAIDRQLEHAGAGRCRAGAHRDAEGAQGQPEDLPQPVRRSAGDVQGGHPAAQIERHRGGDAARALHQLRGLGAVRAVLGRRHHRPARRARHLPRSRPDEGRADVVHPRLCRVPVPQQCAAGAAPHHLDGILARTELGGAGDQRRLAVATSPSRSTARTSAPGPRPAISATSAASTRPTGGSSRAASTAS